MAIKKPVVITTSKKTSNSKDFSFSKDQIRMSGNPKIDAYREKAWKNYETTNIPTTREEPWRRTDIRGLKASQFSLVDQTKRFSFEDIPANLLEPVADGDHGGQIILYGTESSGRLDQELQKKGVIFCDLLTAEQKYPDLLAKGMGNVVKPETHPAFGTDCRMQRIRQYPQSHHFLRAYFSESSATAKIIIAPLMMYCQYGFTPIYVRP